MAQDGMGGQPSRLALVKGVWETEQTSCFTCQSAFGTFTRAHHCRNCGMQFCSKHAPASNMLVIPELGYGSPVRHCTPCFQGERRRGVGAVFNIVEIMLPTVSRDKLLHAVVDVVDAFGDRVEKDNTTVMACKLTGDRRFGGGAKLRGTTSARCNKGRAVFQSISLTASCFDFTLQFSKAAGMGDHVPPQTSKLITVDFSESKTTGAASSKIAQPKPSEVIEAERVKREAKEKAKVEKKREAKAEDKAAEKAARRAEKDRLRDEKHKAFEVKLKAREEARRLRVLLSLPLTTPAGEKTLQVERGDDPRDVVWAFCQAFGLGEDDYDAIILLEVLQDMITALDSMTPDDSDGGGGKSDDDSLSDDSDLDLSDDDDDDDDAGGRPAGSSWMEMLDAKSGKPYYVHRLTGQTKWDKPDESAEGGGNSAKSKADARRSRGEAKEVGREKKRVDKERRRAERDAIRAERDRLKYDSLTAVPVSAAAAPGPGALVLFEEPAVLGMSPPAVLGAAVPAAKGDMSAAIRANLAGKKGPPAGKKGPPPLSKKGSGPAAKCGPPAKGKPPPLRKSAPGQQLQQQAPVALVIGSQPPLPIPAGPPAAMPLAAPPAPTAVSADAPALL